MNIFDRMDDEFENPLIKTQEIFFEVLSTLDSVGINFIKAEKMTKEPHMRIYIDFNRLNFIDITEDEYNEDAGVLYSLDTMQAEMLEDLILDEILETLEKIQNFDEKNYGFYFSFDGDDL